MANQKNSDISLISNKIKGFNVITVKIKNKKIKLRINNINIYNVLATLAVLKVLNLNLDKKTFQYLKVLNQVTVEENTFSKRYKKNFKLIDESYNANPLSVKNALKYFSEIKKTGFKKYLLLGDMLS